MATPVIHEGRVPAEFVGRARAFRLRIIAAEREFARTLDGIYRTIRERLERKPTLRKPECLDLVRLWQSSGRFGHQCNASLSYSKKLTKFMGFRLLSAHARHDDWDGIDDEPCISLSMMTLSINRGELREELRSFYSFSLHSMGRYYQRAFNASDGALIDALWGVLAYETDITRLKNMAGGYTIPASGSGGQWHGELVNSYKPEKPDETRPNIDIRTFFVAEPLLLERM